MSLNYARQTTTAEQYDAIFQRERLQVYPTVDAFEALCGVAIDRDRLEWAARVLSCPLKAAPPNWQHGRVIYARARIYVHDRKVFAPTVRALDIGTAKGFSALCLWWAIEDGGGIPDVVSVDVMPPAARVRRNTVAEVDHLRTLAEILEPWPAAQQIRFEESTGLAWLQRHTERVHLAFIDGKHTGDVVRAEGELLARLQEAGDVAIFDDVQIEGVANAVKALERHYDVEYLRVLPGRAYGIGVRR